METKSAMVICSSQVAKELIEMNENFKQVICICPWLDDDDANNDSVLVVDEVEEEHDMLDVISVLGSHRQDSPMRELSDV